MSEQTPTVVLVHDAFAESANWNGLIERLQARGLEAIAVGNPLRSVADDAAYVRDVIAAGPLFVAPSTRIELSVQAVSRPQGFGA